MIFYGRSIVFKNPLSDGLFDDNAVKLNEMFSGILFENLFQPKLFTFRTPFSS